MRKLCTLLLLFSAVALVTSAAAQDDDSQPSLGDVARQARLQKQKDAQAQAKDAQPVAAATPNKDSATKPGASKDASAKDSLVKGFKRVVTNDEIPEHIGPTSTLPVVVKVPGTPDPPPNYEGKLPADYLKNQIQQMKQYISNLESSIQDLTDSIRYAGGSCVSNCMQWNAEQQRKQQQVEMMTTQLSQQQKALEAAQESARKQGYSSAVYDP